MWRDNCEEGWLCGGMVVRRDGSEEGWGGIVVRDVEGRL